jgi:4-hydroxy-tetrahydrodipicolinate reductase
MPPSADFPAGKRPQKIAERNARDRIAAMMRILLFGCGGAMGKVLSEYTAHRTDCCIAAGIDPFTPPDCSYPVFPSIDACNIFTDIVIDFSHPSALHDVLGMGLRRRNPVIIAVTGHSPEQHKEIEEAAKHIPVFFSANMSFGIIAMAELARKAAALLSDSFDITIIEKHHNRKTDAPSGTALMLADEMRVHDIVIHSVRGGTIAGEHEILFAGHDELISIKHTALSREIYAAGAINAARFLVSRKSGLYTMMDLLNI